MRTTFISYAVAAIAIGFGWFQCHQYQGLEQETQQQIMRLEQALQSKMDDVDTQLSLIKRQEQSAKNAASDRPLRIQIRYLVQWANLQWQSSQNPQMVLPGLALAQQELQHLKDPALAALSEALAHDQRSLGTLSHTGPQAIWTQINAVLTMLQNTETLHTGQAIGKATTSTASANANASATGADTSTHTQSHTHADTQASADANAGSDTSSAPTSWKALVAHALSELKGLVQIRHRRQPIEPLLTTNEQLFVQQELRLALEQARLSSLKLDQRLYDQSIQSAIQYLERYYDPESASTQSLQAALLALGKLRVHTPLPTLSCVTQLERLEQ